MRNIFDELNDVELIKAAETMCRVLEGVEDKENLTEEDLAMFDSMFERFNEEYRNDANSCYKEMEDE